MRSRARATEPGDGHAVGAVPAASLARQHRPAGSISYAPERFPGQGGVDPRLRVVGGRGRAQGRPGNPPSITLPPSRQILITASAGLPGRPKAAESAPSVDLGRASAMQKIDKYRVNAHDAPSALVRLSPCRRRRAPCPQSRQHRSGPSGRCDLSCAPERSSGQCDADPNLNVIGGREWKAARWAWKIPNPQKTSKTGHWSSKDHHSAGDFSARDDPRCRPETNAPEI